jgi:sugar phosphate isomerase/epimerase
VKFRPGLASVTFRQLPALEIIRLGSRAGIEGIEWGGDVHVPPGRLDLAREVRMATEQAGLEVAAYGSYYRAGSGEEAFGPVLETAVELGAPMIRIWAGAKGSAETSAEGRREVAGDLRRICDLAAKANRLVTCEWHGGTLTDTAASANDLLEAAAHPALRTYWQPRTRGERAAGLREMDVALPLLGGLHVFHWHLQTAERLPLAEGEGGWLAYLNKAANAPGSGPLFASIEFVRGGNPAQFLDDAETLRSWLSKPR